ncbi:MAG: rhodanese-like domain-containing protein [Flavobacteriaceae bacterium]|nr:rhodanese-like domain-containing protein [Flavobacteriaceae bacterium]
MKNKNLILFIILLIISTIVFVFPVIFKGNQLTPKTQLAAFISSERYISADELVNKLVNKDPSIVLVDIRSGVEFKQYHIPTAINIPFDSLFNDEYQAVINQEKVAVILYSNDHLTADQAWFLCHSLGYKNLIVLKNGLNGFYNTILNPALPTEIMSQEEKELYDFRKAAGIYFGVPYHKVPEKTLTNTTVEKPIVKKVEPVKKVKVEVEEGGC